MYRYNQLAQELDATEDFRVLQRLQIKNVYQAIEDDTVSIRKGLYIDVETTGLNHDQDEVIELAMIPFRFTRHGQILDLEPAFDQLQEPSKPISTEITELTGITNEMVKGQKIAGEVVTQMVSQVDLVIAHNANFDRKFVEIKWPIFEKKSWGCSQKDIPWSREGIAGSKLEYIAVHYGFFYDAHRAETDCRAGLEILSRDLPRSDKSALRALLENARKPVYRICAEQAPFQSKDILKARGYRWNDGANGQPKAWYIDCSEDEHEAELEYLKADIYQNSTSFIPVKRITAFERFSNRI
ncbi:3'-5' exonuclease [Kiloniella antarctica]|uniref:3'-5' exonuclease n=1 Tax=Kiloniella antarctica TaxID=1550907 RepID=A0ABW5BMR5_9PROT